MSEIKNIDTNTDRDTEATEYSVAALYRFVKINDIPALRKEIQDLGATIKGMCGTILLAPEGVNGTIGAAGAQDQGLKIMIDFLDERLGIREGELKYSPSPFKPFNRFKVRPKKEIITMKCPDVDPCETVGTYVEPQDWNALINDPDVIMIDTRNTYETEVGIFKNAVDPELDVFSKFPEWVEDNLDQAKHKKVAMYCTGGIRCEKASSYMLAKGFENVYHLKGGILKYLETIPAEENLWEGECFVFDNRVAVGHGLEQGSHTICHGCREPLTLEDTKLDTYEKGVSCHKCADTLTPQRVASLRARQAHYESRNS